MKAGCGPTKIHTAVNFVKTCYRIIVKVSDCHKKAIELYKN